MIKDITFRDYDEMIALWKTDPHIRLSSADSPGSIRVFLKRNRGLSLKITEGVKIAATMLCGWDGRRGYFHHLFVRSESRRKGYGKALVEEACARLTRLGIAKVHIFVLPGNETGQSFWEASGFYRRSESDVLFFSRDLE